MPPDPYRPSRAELAAAVDRTVEDVIAPGLAVLFCGINPGLYTAATGHHFARPGNRFWPTLHAAGFTDRLLHPSEERLLLDRGYGITNVVARTTATAAELAPEELVAGGRTLVEKVRRYRPGVLAVLGVMAYRAAFDRPKAALGLQPDDIGDTAVWVLPNPSGLNAHYQRDTLAALFRELHDYAASRST
jgi:double-stranded uracil-DNA glycosylase